MAQVFIVDEKTFKIHLEYKFAGTGSKDNNVKFINNNSNEVYAASERMLVEMLADVSRIRKNDKIIFYLQQKKDREGMFFGSFKAIEKAFICDDMYLNEKLEKNLTFRVLIEPDEVYPIGITERECLDSLEGINKPYELCWSLIYRKLKGNRGCTMITDAEYNYIMNKIRKKNNNKILHNDCLTFNSNNANIEINNKRYKYDGIKESIDIFERMKFKYSKGNSFEAHLQAYILQRLETIKILVKPNIPITWIGNEMSCGVGMQSIDIVFFQEDKNTVNIFVCELKYKQPENSIKNQIYKYVDWLSQYIIPTFNKKKVILNPIIIAPIPNQKTIEIMKNIDFNNNRYNYIAKTRYISFDIKADNVEFMEANYE